MDAGNALTDLELTKLCAEAMGYSVMDNSKLNLFGDEFKQVHVLRPDHLPLPHVWEPLKNDAQAMALVKKLHLIIDSPMPDLKPGEFAVEHHTHWEVYVRGKMDAETHNENLSRAIVECVANMQKAKA